MYQKFSESKFFIKTNLETESTLVVSDQFGYKKHTKCTQLANVYGGENPIGQFWYT